MSGRGGRGGGRGGRGGGPQGGGGGGGPGGGSGGRGGGPRGGGPGAARGGRGGSGGAPRGGPRGAGPAFAPGRGGVPAFSPVASHVQTVGVKRTALATAGRPIQIRANAFVVDVPDSWIYHYDVAMLPDEQTLPQRVNLEIIKKLQEVVESNLFSPRASYDGKKNIYRSEWLFSEDANQDTRTFDVMLDEPIPGRKPPKVYKVRITRANKINAEVLHQFCTGRQSWDNEVQTALQALNIVLRMDPTMKHPFNTRSFFTDKATRDIGAGIELWRGYFQSIRASIGRMLVNVDVATAMMFKRGPLIGTALDFLRSQNIQDLTPGRGFSDLKRHKLQTFLYGCRVSTESAADPNKKIKRTIMRISKQGARQLQFEKDGKMTSVAEYFRQARNRPLRYPDLPCIELNKGGLIPFELCEVIPGQIMRKALPNDKTKDMVEFATMKPPERLDSIIAGLPLLNYGQSEYMRQFGMTVNTAPVQIPALLLNPPTMRYGQGSKDPKVNPRFGAWNMIEKKFWMPKQLAHWIVVSFDDRRFMDREAPRLIDGLVQGMISVGMQVQDTNPQFFVHSPQSNIGQVLDQDGQQCRAKKGSVPMLVVVVLPDGADDVYAAVKHWGDVIRGVSTQCLKSFKCSRANMQYWANVCLKINVKLGGINAVPEPSTSNWLSDPNNPTLVMGADVMHAAPGVERPSYASLVGSVDGNAAKYVSILRPQGSRVESIGDLESMAAHIIQQYVSYRQHVERKGGTAAHPKRILFYRDGVDEGQFRKVLDNEVEALKRALATMKINAKITFIIVGKRHHFRFFPVNPQDGDKNGNLPAGMLVDQGVTHPTDLDFYLLSHSGLLGTSRPSHYSVLYDQNGLSINELSNISFSLCHVYARATRSVSIPAPVYYADIVCSRAKNHYDPNQDLSTTYSQSTVAGKDALIDALRTSFKPLHPNQSKLMYFS